MHFYKVLVGFGTTPLDRQYRVPALDYVPDPDR